MVASDGEVGTEEKGVGPNDLRAVWRAAIVQCSNIASERSLGICGILRYWKLDSMTMPLRIMVAASGQRTGET